MKKKVVIIANFTKLPNEEGNSRFTYLASILDKEKCDVELITSSFRHGTKKQRNKDEKYDVDYKITLIDEPGYSKNVSLKRIYSHKVFAKNVEKYLNNIEKPDVLYTAVPSLDVALVVSKYAKKNNVDFTIDIQDLWPEAFKMVLKNKLLASILFKPMETKANKIYSSANHIVAVSKTYSYRASSVNKTADVHNVYLGTDLSTFDAAKEKNIIDDVIRVAYIGTLGHSYDIRCVIDALKIIKERKSAKVLFVVMGDGPLFEDFEAYANENGIRAEFTGRLPYEEMVGRLCSCDIAVNPITIGAAQSIINKVGDYAAAGLPVINTQENREYRNLVKDYAIGQNVECGDSIDLADKIELLCKDTELRKRCGLNNRKLAEEKFDRRKKYLEIKELIEK